MRRITMVLVVLVVNLLLLFPVSCGPSGSNSGEWKLSGDELNRISNDCCKYVVKKYVGYYKWMADSNDARGEYSKLDDTLRKGHPIDIQNMKYEVLEFNWEKKYWPVKIQCEAIIEPSSNSMGLKHKMDINAKIYKDDFGSYTTQVIRPGYTRG